MVRRFGAMQRSIMNQKIQQQKFLNNPTSDNEAKTWYDKTSGKIDRTVTAYGANLKYSAKSLIDSFNESNIKEGQTKDNAFASQRTAVAKQNGTIDYKKFLRRLNPTTWKNILGIGG